VGVAQHRANRRAAIATVAVGRADDVGDDPLQVGRARRRRQIHPNRSVVERVLYSPSGLERQLRLADAARPRESDQPRRRDPIDQSGKVGVAANQRDEPARQPPPGRSD
jgi:hypothetical protein